MIETKTMLIKKDIGCVFRNMIYDAFLKKIKNIFLSYFLFLISVY